MQTDSRTTTERPLLKLLDLPFVALADLPSPVGAVDRGGLRVLVKNDGLCGSFYGGNKVRKLEFLLADAKHRGYSRVATVGAAGSNHALATAVWSRQAGLQCSILHFAQPPTEHVRKNVAAVALQATTFSHLPSVALLPLAIAWRQLNAWLPRPNRAYWIPGGGSSPVGCLGYVNAVLELRDQLTAAERPFPPRIYVAAGTAGTMAGIVAGLELAGITGCEVVGIRVVDRIVCNEHLVRSLLRGVRKLIVRGLRDPSAATEIAARSDSTPWVLRDDQFGPGYGVTTPEADSAVTIARESLGLYVETTYTAKVIAALEADRHAGTLPDGALYWHTLNQQPVEALISEDFDPARLPHSYQRYFAKGFLPCSA